MSKVKRYLIFFIAALSAVMFFAGCGLEEYAYIASLSQLTITRDIDTKIKIPSSFDGSGMSGFHFIIFYRIYISDKNIPPPGYTDSNTEYQSINPVLGSDYKYFKDDIIDKDRIDDMDKIFRNRGYKYLCLENDEKIDDLLNASVLGKTISFEFPSSYTTDQYPKIIIDGTPHNLFRSTDNGSYRALPDRYFLFKPNFWSSKVTTGDERIDATTNADIVDKENIIEGQRDYAYAAMYIAATAIDDTTYSYVYNTPTFIHVFRLTLKS